MSTNPEPQIKDSDSDEIWRISVEKGKFLLTKMVVANDRTDPATEENFNKDWNAKTYPVELGNLSKSGRLIPRILQHLQLPYKIDVQGLCGFRYVQKESDAERANRLITFDTIGGWYEGSMSAEAGYIAAEVSRSPFYASKGAHEPPLSKQSDLLFFCWKSLSLPLVSKNLKYVFRVQIINEKTRKVIARCVGENIPIWPGKDFSMEEDAGRALLGTPVGSSTAYLLIDHQKELGRKTITHCTVFTVEGDSKYNIPYLLYHIHPQ